MTDTYDDGTKHPILEFDRLGEDFCRSCSFRLKLRTGSMTREHIMFMPGRPAAFDDLPLWIQPPTTAETQQKSANPSKSDIVKGGIDFLGYPVQNRRGLKPNIWIDVLDGNHIMALPSSDEKNKNWNKDSAKGKGKGPKKTKNDVKNTRTPIAKPTRKSARKADQKIRVAPLAANIATPEKSLKGILRDNAASDRTTTKPAGRRVRFNEESEESVKSSKAKKGVEKKKGTRASIPRKVKEKS